MNFSILLQYITPHRKALLMVVVLLLAGSATALIQPWLAGQVTQALLTPEDSALGVRAVITIWLLVLVIRAAVSAFSRYYIGYTGELMTSNLRLRLFAHLQSLPVSFHYQQRGGDTLSLLSYDAQYISSFVTDTLVQMLPLLVTLVGAFTMMILIDPLIAGWALVLLPAFFLSIKIIGREMRPLSQAWIEAHSNLVSFFDEHLDMLPAIKSFVREPIEKRRFDERNAQLVQISRRQLMIQSVLSPVISLISGLGLLLLLWVGNSRIANGELSAADLLSLLLYGVLLSQPLQGLANTYGQVQTTRGAAQRIIDFLNVAAEPDDSGKPALPAVQGDIRFEAVHYHYENSTPVLQGLDLHIRAGEIVAITGPNGAGKTTIAHLLQRMDDPQSGRILIDAMDIAGFSLGSVRSQIGLVSQHTLLLNGTVSQNIAYGQPLIDQPRIERAARQAHAHDFITRLPKGYETVIGDQGLRLSGGQRQRLSLARSLLLDPQILILDEATSMFDPAGEQAFISECGTLLGGKTVILITHRPASLALAQRVIHLPGPAGVSPSANAPLEQKS